jgi:hypothetical protein
MPTPDELRAKIATARQDFQSALEGAGAGWETKPTGDAEGEDAWSPRQVAEHAIGADLYFASEVCGACGYPGLELSRLSLATPADAITAFAEASAKSDGRLKYVSENDLTMQHKSMGSVADVMAIAASHLQEHAAQIRAAG